VEAAGAETWARSPGGGLQAEGATLAVIFPGRCELPLRPLRRQLQCSNLGPLPQHAAFRGAAAGGGRPEAPRTPLCLGPAWALAVLLAGADEPVGLPEPGERGHYFRRPLHGVGENA